MGDIVNLEKELSTTSKEKRINGNIDFSIIGIKTYPNVYDFEPKLSKIIENNQLQD